MGDGAIGSWPYEPDDASSEPGWCRSWLARGVGRLTIKKRGVHVVPEQLRRRLAAAGVLHGDAEAVVVLTRVQGQGRAYLVEPVDDQPRLSTSPVASR